MAKKTSKRLAGRTVPQDAATKRFRAKVNKESAAGPRASTIVPDSWVGGPNRWDSTERDKWREFLADPNGANPAKGSGSRSRPVSMGMATDSVEAMYQRMVKRGVVASGRSKP